MRVTMMNEEILDTSTDILDFVEDILDTDYSDECLDFDNFEDYHFDIEDDY